tara:strand:- start:4633 stop:5739 length:1107 start_codon:yes stop_codon:yes gene_type:complete
LKILVLNNYPLDRVSKEVALGETANHLLYGINFFESWGHKCHIAETWSQKQLPFKYKILKRVHYFQNLGDLKQQSEVLSLSNKFDVLYAPCGTQTQWLQFLRYKKKYPTPIISLVHHPPLNGKLDFFRNGFNQKIWKGLDVVPCLSQYTADLMNLRHNSQKAFTVNWGPDLSFYKPSNSHGEGIVIAGRTSRDFATVIKATQNTSLNTNIFYLQNNLGYNSDSLSPNIKLICAKNEEPIPGKNSGWIKQEELNKHYMEARVIGIPLFEQTSLAGLTSLMDCLGIGKPVIMTKNPNIDIDIEKEGIGHWVSPGDSSEWRRLIQWYENHPNEALEMGKRARALAEGKINSELFAKKMMTLFSDLLDQKSI